jgi:hypothetical protein
MVMAAPDTRRRELAAIHILAAQLGMDTRDQNPDSEYHSMLYTVGGAAAERKGKRSAGHLDFVGRHRVLDHLHALLRARGLKRPRRSAPAAGRDYGRKPQVPADRQALVDKLEALLADAARPWNYARAMAKRMFHMDQLEWATADQLRRLVAALEYDRRRREGRAR